MKFSLIILLLALQLGAQSIEEISVDEAEDPDEEYYLNELLATLFQPFDLGIADSSTLASKGFSNEAIQAILKWQISGARAESLKRLQKRMETGDKTLLEQIAWKGDQGTGITLRQRLQTNALLEGWRILQKGRIGKRWGNLIFLTEQDPGELKLSDHSVMTLQSDAVPGFEQVIVGDFHIRWGAGLIMNQQGFRSSLNPSNLQIRSPLSMTPHYSSRELDYYRGFAAEWTLMGIKSAMFISNRTQVGVRNGADFNEDSDGLHPANKQFQRMRQRTAGIASLYKSGPFHIYSAFVVNPLITPKSQYELGMTWQINNTQMFQVYSDSYRLGQGRSVWLWSYHSQPMVLSIQYRNYASATPIGGGSVIALLGSNAINESGLAVRAQIRPSRSLMLRYGMDTGFSSKRNTLKESNRVVQHKAQVFIKQSTREWQLDFGLKRLGPIAPLDVWNGHSTYDQTARLAISMNQKINPKLQYRLNVKTAGSSSKESMLIQQRLLMNGDSFKASLGFVRFIVPDYGLRLSIYESSLVESMSFYTAYEDGQRWFIYLKRRFREQIDLELKLAHPHLDALPYKTKQLDVSFQLSIVL